MSEVHDYKGIQIVLDEKLSKGEIIRVPTTMPNRAVWIMRPGDFDQFKENYEYWSTYRDMASLVSPELLDKLNPWKREKGDEHGNQEP